MLLTIRLRKDKKTSMVKPDSCAPVAEAARGQKMGTKKTETHQASGMISLS